MATRPHGVPRSRLRVVSTLCALVLMPIVGCSADTASTEPQASTTSAAGGERSAASAGAPRFSAAWQSEPAAERGTSISAQGVAPAAGTVTIERRGSEGWRSVATTTTGTNDTADTNEKDANTAPTRWSVTLDVPERAMFARYRATFEPSAGGANTSSQNPVTVNLPEVNVFEKHTYSVRSRGEVDTDVDTFIEHAGRTLADERGWPAANHRFVRVDTDAPTDFVLWLAAPEKVPTFSGSCSQSYSCRVGSNVIINHDNWKTGTNAFPGELDVYRDMVINHEVGHYLGLGHQYCSAPGEKAPVMMQQSKGVGECEPNPWPLEQELDAAR